MKITTWQKAAKYDLILSSPCGTYTGPVDRGVNYFVLMLQQQGATTHYSCEGHPKNFYILFESGTTLARRIQSLGCFHVEVEHGQCWSLRRDFDTEAEKQYVFTLAAKAWNKAFGPLEARVNRAANTIQSSSLLAIANQ